MSALAVICKTPAPGRVKTRLCPPCTPEQAAALALAALCDTLDAVRAVDGVARRVLVLDGDPGPWADGFEVVAQRGDGLDERLANGFDAIGDRCFLVGMDTPQLTPALLRAGLDALDRCDASFGPALDGGYWGIGLRRPEPEVFLRVPMSVGTTGAEQLARLDALGLDVASLPALLDVDHFADAQAVAALAPDGRFARAVASVDAEVRA